LRRVTSAVDTGISINPDTIMAQLQGGLIFGLTAALYSEVNVDKERVQQSNFNDYRMLRIDQARTSKYTSSRVPRIRAASARPG
jgi:isoquinoline 1-oxidoreductase beta subunit